MFVNSSHDSMAPCSDTDAPRHAPGPRCRPPASLRPRRAGRVIVPGQGRRVCLARGVEAEWLVGQHTGARNLTTGLITIAPNSSAEPLSHPHYGSLTVLLGSVTLQIGSRRIDLQSLDNVVIGPGQSHALANPRADQIAVLHASYPTDQPRHAPARSSKDGAIFLTCYADARRYDAAPGASFIDHFGSRQIPGMRMCGGMGTFAPGARLPAHVHDFDESICIIAGQAVCWAEGKRLVMGDCATALQPRGRAHYFVNETDAPMAMIWVYAGPTPQRIVVDDRCATQEGFAWPREARRD